jgi:membrane protease YdiL (CAAX protease family)
MICLFVAAFILFTLLNIVTRRFGLVATVLGVLVILPTRGYALLWEAQDNLLALLLFLPLGILSFYLSLALYEELLWRGALPFVFGNLWLGMVSSAVLFSLIHVNKRREVFLAEIGDIFVFAVFQGILLILFRNIYLLIFTHTVRNLLIYHWALHRCSNHIRGELAIRV